MSDNVVDEWFQGGRDAIMLMTSSLNYPDVSDPAYPAETGALLAGMSPSQMALAMAWMARFASQAMLDRHDGERELALLELQAMGIQIEEARASVGDSR